MAGLTPLPPTVFHSSQRLTHAQAHTQLSSFLDFAENDAAYRPDSTLTERGPQSASTGANPNLTLHHLKRILQGIEGKRLGGADTGRFFGDGAAAAGVSRLPRPPRKDNDKNKRKTEDTEHHAKRRQIAEADPEDGENTIGIATEERDDWQDKGDYELAQREGGMELLDDDRQPGITLAQPRTDQEAEDMLNVAEGEDGEGHRAQKPAVDKKARKEAKKARRKDEQREKNAAIRTKK